MNGGTRFEISRSVIPKLADDLRVFLDGGTILGGEGSNTILAGGGFVVDTPGFSLTEFVAMAPDELRFQYREFRDKLAGCHFSSCLHHREPQCAVKQAVQTGEIAPWRYESYIELLTEIQQTQQRRF